MPSLESRINGARSGAHVPDGPRPRCPHWSRLLAPLLAALALLSPGTASAESADDVIARELAEQARLQAELDAERKAAKDRARAEKEAELRAEEAAQAEAIRRAQKSYGSLIADEMAAQSKLLYQATGRGEAPDELLVPTDDPIAEAFLDPRVAPQAPRDRDLPEEIFDAERVTVPADTWGEHPPYDAIRQVLDADGDGRPELVRWVDRATGALLGQEADLDYDGNVDAWNVYGGGVVVRRRLDQNDDGNPDTWDHFENGRAVRRERDRDDDGVRDVFYRYAGTGLVEEKHDANNDGRVDLVIHYAEGRRERSEEDLDRDGRMDTWTTWVADPETGAERVGRKERDRKGDGVPDTVEVFAVEGGESVIERREEDEDGDGSPDVISHYEGGKLKRRQIAEQ